MSRYREGEDLSKTLERLDALLAETKNPERLRMGMGIRLALGMAQEIREGLPLGSRTAELAAAWTDEHGGEAVDRAVQIAREFLTKPDALRKAMAQRLGLDGRDASEAGTEVSDGAAEDDAQDDDIGFPDGTGPDEPGTPA